MHRNQIYSDLTAQQKRNLTQALKHNKFDVEALEVLYGECLKTDRSLINRQIKPLFEEEELIIEDWSS